MFYKNMIFKLDPMTENGYLLSNYFSFSHRHTLRPFYLVFLQLGMAFQLSSGHVNMGRCDVHLLQAGP